MTMETTCTCGRRLLVDDETSKVLEGRHCKFCGKKFFYQAAKYSLIAKVEGVEIGSLGFKCRNCGSIFTDSMVCKAQHLAPPKPTRAEQQAAKEALRRGYTDDIFSAATPVTQDIDEASLPEGATLETIGGRQIIMTREQKAAAAKILAPLINRYSKAKEQTDGVDAVDTTNEDENNSNG